MIEARSSEKWGRAKKALQHNFEEVKALISLLEPLVVTHLKLQLQAGCSVLQLFDSQNSLVPPQYFEELCIAPLKRILSQVKSVPLIYFKADSSSLSTITPDCDPISPVGCAKKTRYECCYEDKVFNLAKEQREVDYFLQPSHGGDRATIRGITHLSLDHTVPLENIRDRVPKNIALQGNLDSTLLQDPKRALSTAKEICTCMQQDPGFIFNLSGGIPPTTKEETIKKLVETVRSL